MTGYDSAATPLGGTTAATQCLANGGEVVVGGAYRRVVATLGYFRVRTLGYLGFGYITYATVSLGFRVKGLGFRV